MRPFFCSGVTATLVAALALAGAAPAHAATMGEKASMNVWYTSGKFDKKSDCEEDRKRRNAITKECFRIPDPGWPGGDYWRYMWQDDGQDPV